MKTYVVHVIPIDDIEEHELHEDCWCFPLEGDEGEVIHNAKDCREKYERQGLATKPWTTEVEIRGVE